MNALAELRKRTRTAANPANPAKQGGVQAVDSQHSQDSQGVDSKSGIFTPAADALKAERVRLLALAAAEWINAAHVHRMADADLSDWIAAGLDDGQRRAFLHLLADTADRHAGRVPLDDTAPMYCQHCGPVWTHPDIAAVLPVVDGWPRALGCPWCAVRKAGGYIPRPSVTCGDCQHFTPDVLNPPAGMGICANGHGTHYPMTTRRCAEFSNSARKRT
jgi:hypothetical protein